MLMSMKKQDFREISGFWKQLSTPFVGGATMKRAIRVVVKRPLFAVAMLHSQLTSYHSLASGRARGSPLFI